MLHKQIKFENSLTRVGKLIMFEKSKLLNVKIYFNMLTKRVRFFNQFEPFNFLLVYSLPRLKSVNHKLFEGPTHTKPKHLIASDITIVQTFFILTKTEQVW